MAGVIPFIRTDATGACIVGQGLTVNGPVSFDGPSGIASNVIIGGGAGVAETTGSSNVYVGQNAGAADTTGSTNVFVGQGAGQSNTTASTNTFLGQAAGQANTTAAANVFVGQNAGTLNTTGATNTFVGQAAGALNTTGATNTFLGQNAGSNNTTGANHVAVGAGAGPTTAALANTTTLGQGAVTAASNTCVLGVGQQVIESLAGHVYFTNAAVNHVTTDTLAGTDIAGGIVTASGVGAVNLVLPTGASLDAVVPNAAVGSTLFCKLYNNSAGLLTFTDNGAVTQLGTPSIAIAGGAFLVFRRTGAATYIMYS